MTTQQRDIQPDSADLEEESLPSVTVVVEPIIGNEAVGSTSYVQDSNDQNIYTDYQIHNHYENDRHVYMMGVTAPGGFNGNSAAFVQLALPTTLWIMDWTAARFCTTPDIPDPQGPTDDGWVLLDAHVNPVMIVTAAGGGDTDQLYRINGTYFYGASKPSDNVISDAVYPRPPWLEDVYLRTISLESLKTNLGDNTESILTGGPVLGKQL